ncbi:hypothetical protein JMJ55_04270 [Belnapia sp. T6]|uniref:Uncharacterized protein n=1 Tax=Belnapia mucosa TaxID=2804532 RepID=A0ABS1UZ06_9PROT|nr:hypothetical protein [Belnapia mucosa]MBL6454527.1 hypothetical protein [Belnapia mucosa]
MLAAVIETGKAVPVKFVWRPFDSKAELERAAKGSVHNAGDTCDDLPEVKS